MTRGKVPVLREEIQKLSSINRMVRQAFPTWTYMDEKVLQQKSIAYVQKSG